MGGRCAGFINRSLERGESNSTALSVIITLAGRFMSLSSPPLSRLLPRVTLSADQRVTQWGRLPESRLEATRPDGSDEGKHLARNCLFVECADSCL